MCHLGCTTDPCVKIGKFLSHEKYTKVKTLPSYYWMLKITHSGTIIMLSSSFTRFTTAHVGEETIVQAFATIMDNV